MSRAHCPMYILQMINKHLRLNFNYRKLPQRFQTFLLPKSCFMWRSPLSFDFCSGGGSKSLVVPSRANTSLCIPELKIQVIRIEIKISIPIVSIDIPNSSSDEITQRATIPHACDFVGNHTNRCHPYFI